MAATSSATEPSEAPEVSGLRLAHALFTGIIAWLIHLIGQSALNGWVCRTGQLWPMHVLTVVTLLITLQALWTGWAIRRAADPAPSIQAARFLGTAAVVINAFNAAMIVVEWVPVVFIHPCAIG